MSKPKVDTNPVANRYANANERIIEYSLPGGPGGLISMREHHDEPGHLIVEIYQHDAAVDIRVGKPREGTAAVGCDECGLPAKFHAVDVYGPDERVQKLCAQHAAEAACDGESISRMDEGDDERDHRETLPGGVGAVAYDPDKDTRQVELSTVKAHQLKIGTLFADDEGLLNRITGKVRLDEGSFAVRNPMGRWFAFNDSEDVQIA